jgi:hypothetical protein
MRDDAFVLPDTKRERKLVFAVECLVTPRLNIQARLQSLECAQAARRIRPVACEPWLDEGGRSDP